MVTRSTALDRFQDAADIASRYLDPAQRALEPVGDFLGDAMERACNWYGNNPNQLLQQSPIHASLFDSVCEPYYSGNGYDGPRPAVQGGQCDTLYDIQVVNDYGFAPCDDPSDVTEIFQEGSVVQGQPGPIRWLGEFDVEFKSCGGTKKSTSFIGVENANGNRFGGGANRDSRPGEFIVYNRSFVRVTRSDGQPDDCGDDGLRPGETPPPPYEMGEEYDPPGLPPGSGPARIFAPEININGDINVPVCIKSVCINLMGGDGGPNVDVPPPKSDRPKTAQPPLGEGDLGDGEEEGDLPPPPPGTEYQAVQVEIEANAQFQPPIPETGPAEVYPAILGNVTLKLEDEAGNAVVSESVRQRCRRFTYVRPDAGLTLKGVYVSLAANSVSFQLTPITVTVEESDDG